MDYNRLQYLKSLVTQGKATKIQKDELMKLLYQNGSISRVQYDDYLGGRDTDEILNAALVVAGTVLLGYLLGRLFRD